MSEDAKPGDVHWLVRPATIRRLWQIFAVILAVVALADLFLEHHPFFGIDGTFGFYAWYGFATCVAMVLFAKLIGLFLKRRDDYYDGD